MHVTSSRCQLNLNKELLNSEYTIEYKLKSYFYIKIMSRYKLKRINLKSQYPQLKPSLPLQF